MMDGSAAAFDKNNCISAGDYVYSIYLKGYFKVYKIKPCFRDGSYEGNLLLLKKILTKSMKFSISTDKCHADLCAKVGASELAEIERLLDANPGKRKKIDSMPPLFPCLQEHYFLDMAPDDVVLAEEKIKHLPKYFSKRQFEDFLNKVGLSKHIKANPASPKDSYILSVYTQQWMVDGERNYLYCNPQIGKTWGKLAKLNVDEFDDFDTSGE